MPETYKVLARAYRPQRFADVIGQEAILRTLKNALQMGKIAHGYLFSGSRGVGKTTLARLFAKALNCQSLSQEAEPCNQCPSCLDISSGQSLDVIEIDGASNRGIEDIRQINETVAFAPSHGKYKIYIIDEVHMLTKEAFNALLKTLEEPPERAKFFFATTEPHKILATIVSRCQRFDLGRLSISQIVHKLQSIASDLQREVHLEALHLLAQAADGSLRDAESLLDQVFCFTNEKVTSADVQSILGLAPQELFFSFDQAFSETRLGFAFELVHELSQKGKDFKHFLEQLIEHFRHLSVCKTLGSSALHLSPSMISSYEASAKLYTQPQTLAILDLLLKAEGQFSKATSPRVNLELTLLQILRIKNKIPVEILVRRLSELEELLACGKKEEPPAPAKIPAPEEPIKMIAPQETEEKKAPDSSELTDRQLKPVPFNPYIPAALEPMAQKENKLPVQAVEPEIKTQQEKAEHSSHHPSHYDTIVRFAAVELEGTFKN